ncbi:MAG: SRPBCC family protein, partial [Candidatus Zixiibacteriota bacterium]
MAARKNSRAENLPDREIVSTRLFDSPRELVWKAWTDPKHLAEWWGPRGFTNTFEKFDFKTGGTWRFSMHGANGKDFHNESVFTEIVKNKKIVFDHIKPIHKFQVTATFVEQKDKTNVTFTMLFESAEECAAVIKYAAEKNEENFD